MSETNATQLCMPAKIEDEENVVLDRFIQASKEIAPSLQVTLAKRYIQPGSNRVLCLAARTTVPLNENELASVSDLALRLSDGTNVHLSLSVFDESSGTSYHQQPFQQARPAYASNPFPRQTYNPHPFPQTPYEPYRYEVHVTEKSKLGSVFVAMILVMGSALYMVANWSPKMTANLEDLLRRVPFTANLLKLPHQNVVAARSAISTFPVPAKTFGKPTALPDEHNAGKGWANQKGRSGLRATSGATNAPHVGASHTHRHGRSERVGASQSDEPRGEHSRHGSMLVPPPPPMIYTLPPGAPPAMSQFWGFPPQSMTPVQHPATAAHAQKPAPSHSAAAAHPAANNSGEAAANVNAANSPAHHEAAALHSAGTAAAHSTPGGATHTGPAALPVAKSASAKSSEPAKPSHLGVPTERNPNDDYVEKPSDDQEYQGGSAQTQGSAPLPGGNSQRSDF